MRKSIRKSDTKLLDQFFGISNAPSSSANLKPIESASSELFPIIEEFETEFIKEQKRNFRYKQFEQNLKIQKENRQKNYQNIVKTQAIKRNDAYYNSIGLPQSYGKYAPFYPFNCQHNLRYFKKKKVKE